MDKDTLKLFGERLRTLRKERKLTQEGLAQRCQMYSPYLGEIERGAKNPTLLTLHKIANGLDMSIGELLSMPSLEKNEWGKALAYLSETNPRKQKRIIKALRLMVD
jgi:transcriptional regulator with XRE-family HTH domain